MKISARKSFKTLSSVTHFPLNRFTTMIDNLRKSGMSMTDFFGLQVMFCVNIYAAVFYIKNFSA